MRTLAWMALLLPACATVQLPPGEDDVAPVHLLRAIDQRDDSGALSEGMRGVFGGDMHHFAEGWRGSHGKLAWVRVVSHSGDSWDVDALYASSPFAERLRFVLDGSGALAGFWYHGAGSGLMTDAELGTAFAAISGRASAFVQAAEHREIQLGYRATEPQPVASQYKTLLLARACAEVGQGKRALTDRLALPAEVRGTPSCVLCKFEPGLQPTLRDYLHVLVADSDNTSADFLRGELGLDAIGRTAQANGVAHVPPIITTEGLFALECGLGPLRNVPDAQRAAWLAAQSPDARLQAADDAAHDGFSLGPDAFGERCGEGNSSGDTRKAIAHTIDWNLRADELVALYENAQLGQLDSAEASRCFLRFMGDGGSGPIPLGEHYLSAGAKNGLETDVRSLGLVVQTDRGPIAVSVSAFAFPDSDADKILGELYDGAHALVEWTYARLPAR